MIKEDFLWLGSLMIWIIILIIPSSRDAFVLLTTSHPYIGGFIKFAILATMGELLGIRLNLGYYKKPNGLFFRGVIWGLLGIVITLAFPVFSKGIYLAQESGLLPFYGSLIAQAFFTSFFMNIIQSPTIFLFHKCTDTYIDLKYKLNSKISLNTVATNINWYNLISFTILKTIPFFWIPCHTIVFLLPSEYRVLASAFLSIALGLILSLSTKNKTKVSQI